MPVSCVGRTVLHLVLGLGTDAAGTISLVRIENKSVVVVVVVVACRLLKLAIHTKAQLSWFPQVLDES